MKRTLNFRFLGLLLAVLAVVALGGNWLHGRQLKRNSSYLLNQAGQAILSKDFSKAQGYLNHYLTFHPGDGRARAKYGVLLARRAKSKKEFEFAYLTIDRALRDAPGLERVLRDDPELQDLKKNADAELSALADAETNIRRRAAELARHMGEFTDAKVHLEAALQDHPTDADLLVMIGVVEESVGKTGPAAKAYEAAIDVQPGHVESYVRLAYLLRRTDKKDAASAVMERLVAANPDLVRARLAAVKYFRDADNLLAARTNLAAATSGTLKDDKDVLLATADVAIAEKSVAADVTIAGKHESAAREALRRGLELHPTEPQFYLVLAGLDLQAGKRDDAVTLLRKAVGVLPKESAEVWFVADLLIDADERGEARKLVARLRDEKADAAVVDFLDARLHLAEGRAKKAEEVLRRNEAELGRKTTDLATRTSLLLAACYEKLGQPDLRLKAARRAVSLAPAFLPARLAHADALLGVGKTDEAIAVYRGGFASAKQLRFKVARIQLLQGDLKGTNETLDGLTDELANTADALLIRALVLAKSGDKENQAKARRAVEAARDQYPKEPAFWVFLANTAADPKDGLALLDKAQTEAGNGATIRLARANLLAKQKADPAALRALEAGAESLPDDERTVLSLGLASVHLRLGSPADAERLLRQTADRQPGSIELLFRLFEVVAEKASQQELEDLRKKAEDAEGEGGAVWRLIDAYRGWREYLADKSPAALDHARKQLIDAGKRRPEWFWVPLLEGEIEDRQGRPDAAIELFLRAIRLGAVGPVVVARTARLMLARQRVEEAHQLIADVRRRAPALPRELERLDAEAAARLGAAPDDIVERLKLAAPESSTDHRDHLLRAGLLAVAGRAKDAEAAHRRAVELAPTAPEAWVGLVFNLARADRVPEAKAEIANAAKAVPAEKRAQTLGPCYDAVGDRAEAEKQYLQAAEGADPAALRALVTFYLGAGEAAKAEPILRRLVAEPGSRRWARRALALVLAPGGDAQGNEAIDLLRRNLAEHPGSPEDQRTLALIHAARPNERRDAIKELEASFARLPAAPAEEFMLARLYELDGDWAKASERMVSLLGRRGGDAPAFLAAYISALLRHKDMAGAERWMEQLKAKTKEKERTAELVELQARIDAARGRGAAAAQAVKAYARETHAAKPNPKLLRACGTLLAELKLTADAEELLREYVKVAEPREPFAVLVLADFMARHQNRVSNALPICSEALARVDADLVAQQVVAVVRLGEASDAHYTQAEEIIKRAAKAKPNSTDIPVSLADLRDAQGRYDDAKAMYREILRENPRNVLAMNNLAWLLTLHEGKKDEALGLLEDAVRLIGEDGNLLDTRGVVHLNAGNPTQAVADLTKAIKQDPRPERYFHLAQAHQKAGNTPEALRAMRKAGTDGLSKTDLHRLEFKAYDDLIGLVGGR